MRSFVIGLVLAGAASAEPLYLGILEGDMVRVAFEFQDGKWTPMPGDDLNPATMGAQYPRAVTWTIAFDGRNLGTVKSAQLKKYSNRGELGLQELKPESQKWIKTLSPGIRMKDSQARKLVVISVPNYQDPDHWQPFPAGANSPAAGQARAAFRKLGQQETIPCDCPEKLIRICSKPYRSARGEILIGVVPRDNQCGCFVYESWFLIQSGKAVNFSSIWAGGDSLHFIDAGDYDGDGVSEVLFFADGVGDGRDAFVLLSKRDASVQVFTLPGPYTF